MNNILKTGLLYLVVANLAVSFAFAENPDIMTLDECLEYALANNRDIKISELQVRQSEHTIQEAKSVGLPQVNAYATFDDNLKLPTQMLPGEFLGEPGTTVPVQFGTQFSSTAGVQVDQLLYNQSYFVGLKASKASEQLSFLEKEKTEEDVIYTVTANYYKTLQYQEELKIIDNNLELFDRLLKIMKVRVENDLIREVDYNRVKVNKINLETQRKALEVVLNNQKDMLKFYMGLPVGQEINLDNHSVTAFKESDVLNVLNMQPEERIELKILKQQLELNQLNEKYIASGYYPTLKAYGRYTFQGQRNSFNELYREQWFDASVIGVRLDIPIFDGFKKKHQIIKSELDQSVIQENTVKTKEIMNVEQQTAMSRLSNGLDALEAQQENVELAGKVLKQVNSLYSEGVSQLTDLLDAETAFREAQIEYNRVVINIKIAELDLAKSNGKLKN